MDSTRLKTPTPDNGSTLNISAVKLTLAACVSIFFSTGLAIANESLINTYSERLARLKLEVHNETKRRTTILDQLDQTIVAIDKIKLKTSNTKTNTPSIAIGMQDLATERERIDQKLAHNELVIEELRKTLQTKSRPSIWRAALGQNGPMQKQRALAVHRYLIHTAEKNQIDLEALKTSLDKRQESLSSFDTGIAQEITDLGNEENDLLTKRIKLETQLIEVSSAITNKQDQVSLLTKRQETLQENPASLQFANMKAKLPDPVNGSLQKSYSEPKARGLLKWSGILIEAPLGEKFTAVSDGTVVFASELQGLGNVAILDHGDGYMSLYGMAELLLVEENQFLIAGDPIGTVGEPVGRGESALYFEIRHNAQTLDPQDWLEMHQISANDAL